MSMDDLIKKFSFEHCSKAGAKFDYQKAAWFNHEYIMRLPDKEVARLFMPVLAAHEAEGFTPEYVELAVGMVKGRVNFIGELWDQADFFFRAPDQYAPKDIKKRWGADTPRIMAELIEVLEGIDDMTSANAEKIVLDWIAQKGYHLGNVMNAFRLCVVGACRGPHMFDITELMPRQEVVARIRRAIDTIPAPEDK